MDGNSAYITNLVNSIIGVSVLAMPFCLKQCGIILGLGLLLSAAWLTYLSCSMLASSAYQKRRRSYEYLALYTLGPTGKFAVELSMIGLMLGTCIAFYVVIGDLSYGTIAKFVPGADKSTLRMYTIIFTALCIALPLGNMKNLSVLSYFGFVSLLFYSAFLVVVILNAVSNGLLNWEWLQKVNYWRPAGIFQCLPIFSLAYACQCQLFIVYSSLEEPTVHRIEDIVFGAIRFVTVAYMSIGFFGYTTYQEAIAGNLLLNFPSNALLDFIKMGFAMSVVLGFPLMISPCRQSIHTLLFAQPAGEGMQTATYIPPFLFKSITLGIVTLTMFIAIVIPNVETILGLTGATMGSMICFIFPALIYEKAHSSKASSNTPKFVFVLGCILLVVCTYSNLSKITNPPPVELPPEVPAELPEINLDPVKVESDNVVVKDEPKDAEKEHVVPNDKEELQNPKVIAEVEGQDHRHEPPNPVEPPDNPGEADKDDTVVDVAKGIDEKKPDTDDSEGKQDSPKEQIKVEEGVAPKDNAESVVKQEEEVKKEEPAPVEKPKSPVQEIAPQVKHDEESKVGGAVNKIGEGVQEPKKVQQNINPPADKEAPKSPATLSPKIIKKDENAPAVDTQVRNDGAAQPGIQQGSPLKEQQADKVENPQKDAPVADSVQNDESKKGDDTADEKELLEKIKEQHDMQQQLLKEQEQLIKKLEEHQDKKDQAGEEDGQIGGFEQNAHQGAPPQDQQEIKQPVNPPQIEKLLDDKPLPQNEDIVNNDDSQKNDVVLPQGGALKNDESHDKMPEDSVVKQNEGQEVTPELAGNKVVAGRELLSNENEHQEDDERESVINDELAIDRPKGDESPKLYPAKGQENPVQQNAFIPPNGRQRLFPARNGNVQPHFPNQNLPNNLIKQHHNPRGDVVLVTQNNPAGHKILTMDERERWLRMQQQAGHPGSRIHDESDVEAVRKPRDLHSQYENDENTNVDASVLEHNAEKQHDDGDTAVKMSRSEISEDSQHEIFIEDNTGRIIKEPREPREDELFDAKDPVRGQQNQDMSKEPQSDIDHNTNRPVEEPMEDGLLNVEEPVNSPIVSDIVDQQNQDMSKEPQSDIDHNTARPVEEPMEDGLLAVDEPVNPPIVSDLVDQQNQDISKEPLSDIQDTNHVEPSKDKDYDVTEKHDDNKPVMDCLENDLKCWQSKSKSRELKSLDLN